jgi:hypothetical protein
MSIFDGGAKHVTKGAIKSCNKYQFAWQVMAKINRLGGWDRMDTPPGRGGRAAGVVPTRTFNSRGYVRFVRGL